MKTFFVMLLATLAVSSAQAQEMNDCAAKAADKKLAGAALKSFVTKCEKTFAMPQPRIKSLQERRAKVSLRNA